MNLITQFIHTVIKTGIVAFIVMSVACKETEEVYAKFFVSAAPTCTDAHLSWNAVSQDSTIIYSVYLNDRFRLDCKGISCDLNGLKGNTSYSGHLVARKGSHTISQANFSFTTTDYPAPTDFKLYGRLVRSDSLIVSWTKPSFPLGGSQRFTVSINGDVYSPDSTVSILKMGGLSAKTSYYVIATATDTLNRSLTHSLDIVTLSTQGAQLMEKTLVCDQHERSYWLYIPSGVEAKQLPLFVFLHGAGGDAFKNMKNFSLKNIAEKNKFIVAMPQALVGTTTDGTFTQWDDHKALAWDDVLFLNSMIDSVQKNQGTDKSRVFLSGMSNGGFMTLSMATLSNRFSAIAPMSGLITYANQKKLTNWPLPMLIIHGTADGIVKYNGGGYCAGVDDLVKFWTSKNGCDSIPTITNLPDKNVADGSTVTLYQYSGVNAKARVQLYKVVGGGHAVAGNETGANYDIDAFEVAWDFFRNF